ncbi:MAG: MATE family efflux transporter [Oscillospiraceae bacterium]|nr:MATE family efflux transporter [Oscillospiraceae bacterium]
MSSKEKSGSSGRAGQRDLTVGSIPFTLISFALPFFLSMLMQSLYGAVDLFVIGRYAGTSAVSAVSNGTQLMQIIGSVVMGTSTGVTVSLGRHIGERDNESCANTVGSGIIVFAILAAVFTPVMVCLSRNIISLVKAPPEAFDEAVLYLRICSCGLPFIAAYNLCGGIFRGIGNSKQPMYFMILSCCVNIVGDILLVGVFKLGAGGAAAATVFAQIVSSAWQITYFIRHKLPFAFNRVYLKLKRRFLTEIIRVGVPIAFQDVLIGVAFTAITVIANKRGLIASSSVGVVEKTIMFMFLVPSAMTSAISAITAQNIGAGKKDRAKKTLRYGMGITLTFGIIVCVISQIIPVKIASIFTSDQDVIISGSQYLRSYVLDCVLVAVTFCMNGYFTGSDRASFVFLHDTISIFLVRIPVAYLMSLLYPDSLYPMGFSSPAGSLSSIIIISIYMLIRRKKEKEAKTLTHHDSI